MKTDFVHASIRARGNAANRSYHFFALGLFGVLVSTGCGRHGESSNAPPNLPAAAVRVQTVESKKRLATEEIVGTVRAKLRATLEAKVSGRIEKMFVLPGQMVKSGELLARLEAREIQAKLDQALAQRDQADRDLARFIALLQQKAVTQQEFDGVETRQRTARAAVSEAETMLGYAKITAPFDGVVARKLADVGDLAAPGRPLLELEDPSALQFEADVPEAIIDRVRLEEKLPVRVSSLNDDLEGTVSEIAPVIDPNSRTFRVKLDLAAWRGLRAGQFGRVAVPVREISALRAPASAVIQRGQLEIVFVAVGQRAELRLIKTGKRVGQEIELISGINPGDRVVTEGAADLLDGQPITIKP